ncbi:sucrose-6-phosphate hydrolase [Sansalvadorimonas verongulae]|uniref:sucrose-6-phosphate hydrolase n=1 Tax=Sansalvadorimonas verongulae TaxID=2172824 RepID=UPI0012BB6DDE|nr:sucrose-6-phosphate hydrolase [Sansalvadorimonas verongulae]MTI15060.1 sucrose-6-phosphate hydrolase [Sansalvadorimonas verongulae]
MSTVSTKEGQLRKQLADVLNQEHHAGCQPWRPVFHLSPSVGLLNDPNGFIHYQGRYHLFYQWNPFACGHGPKFWGHVSSENLCDWQEHSVALVPSEDYESHGCYSGSAIEREGALLLFYTGNVKFSDGGRTAWQCVAEVTDDEVLKKGPVLGLPKGYTGHVRDPKVWQHSDGCWYMVLAAQDRQMQGKVLLYRSRDAFDWHLVGEMAGSQTGSLGDFGYMWECPDLFLLGGKDFLLVCPQGLEPEGDKYQNLFQCGYFSGQLDYQSGTYSHGEFTELDAGFDFYAPQTTEDASGRRLIYGWLGLPDENESSHPTIEHGWIHCMSIPRELIADGNRLKQRPARELMNLRQELVIDSLTSETFTVPEACELLINSVKAPFALHFREAAELAWDGEFISLSRLNWRTGQWEHRRHACKSVNDIRLFHDSSTLEIFINDGSIVMSSRFFPEKNHQVCKYLSDIPGYLQVWSMRPSWLFQERG